MANITGKDEIYLPRTPLFDVVSIVCSIALEHLFVKAVVSANPANANSLEIPGVLGWSVAP